MKATPPTATTRALPRAPGSMPRPLTTLLLLLAVGSLTACDDARPRRAAAPDAGPTADTTSPPTSDVTASDDTGPASEPDVAPEIDVAPKPDLPEPVPRWRLFPDGPATGNQTVFLALAEVAEDEVVVRVAARSVPKLGGVAFRVAFAPGQAEVMLPEAAIGLQIAAAGKLVSAFAVQPEGEVWGGVVHKGEAWADASVVADVALFTVRPTSRDEPVRLDLIAPRCRVQGPGGELIGADWQGAEIRWE